MFPCLSLVRGGANSNAVSLNSHQTNGVGVDHVVEVGGSGTMAKTVQAVRYGGWVHAIGYVAEVRLATLDGTVLYIFIDHSQRKGGDEVNIAMSAIVKAFILRGIQIGSVAQ